MRRILALLPLIGLLVFGFGLTALAHSFTGSGDCDGWTLQLDGTWDAYDITVDSQSIGLDQTVTIPDSSDNTSRTFVVRWWKQELPDVTRTVTVERTLECDSDTTTTTSTPSSTTTTDSLPTTTSTTAPSITTTTTGNSSTSSSTSTTTPALTTTVPGLQASEWTASSTCHQLTAEWGEGIVQVDVWLRDPQFGDIQLDSFHTPGTLDATTGEPSEFILIPVVLTGYEAVPDQVSLHTDVCTPTTAGLVTTTIPTDPTLPNTGSSDVRWETLAFSAFALIVLGGMAVLEGRR